MPSLMELNIPFFNPVVDEWNEEAQKKEEEIKNKTDTIELYVITGEMTGVFSIAEIIDASNKRPERTILHINDESFKDDDKRINSLLAVNRMAHHNGATCVDHFNSIPAVCLRLIERNNFPKISATK